MTIRFISLIGYRGSGKSTVAQQLATRLGWHAVDTDTLIEQRAGKTIAEIFASDGEEHFRDLETAAVADATPGRQCVLATGGGVVLRETNRKALAGAGPVVWLQAGPEVLWDRISRDATTHLRRPALTPEGGLAEVQRLLQVRSPLYRQIATLELDAEELDIAAIVNRICAELPLDA